MNTTKKHIVFLTDCLAGLGGAEKQIIELAKGLDKNCYDIHIISLDYFGERMRSILETTGCPFYEFRVVRIYGISGLIQGFRFRHFLKENHIDIVLTYHFSSDIWGSFWGHWAGVKAIISNRRDMGSWRNGFHTAAYRFVNRWVKKIVVVSASIKAVILKEERFNPGNIEVIYNGVHLPKSGNQDVNAMRAKLGLGNNDIVIMHVANLKPIKGHQYLLEAFAGIAGQYPLAKLVLIGRDEFNGHVQDMAKELRIADQVLYLGKREDVQELLSVADICVLPSLSEGMSNAVLEYMAAAKPVIATDVGGNAEMIRNGIDGFIIEKENSQQIQSALLDLIKSPEKCRRMGRAGYGRVRDEFSMPAMIKNYDRLFSGIRVLHLISSVGLFGAERVVLNLVAVKCEGITPVVGAIHNTHNPHLEMITEAKQLSLNTIVFESKGRLDLATITRVKDYVLNNKIDIIHSHNYKSDFIAAGAARLSGAKWVATHHGRTMEDQKLKLYEQMDYWLLRYAKKIVLVSDQMKGFFLNKGIKSEQLEIIDNGIPIEKFSKSTQRERTRVDLGINAGDCAVVIIGRLAKEKGHSVFLKAAAEIAQKIQNVKFVIVGVGPLLGELEQQVQELNLTKIIIFTGVRNDMPEVYSACDILVNASLTEGLPMTILEAMASHLPIIATNVGAVGKVIHDQENGLLLEAGDDKALSRALLELIQDKEKRQRFAQKAYQDVCERFSDTRMAGRYQEIYSSILGDTILDRC